MYRFFVEPQQIEETFIHITGGDAHHIAHVLRMKKGGEILVSDKGKMEYTCHIEEITPGEVLAKIHFGEEAGLELPSKIYLFQCLPKSDKMELIVQKAVELGVCEVIPVASARCVVKLDEKKEAAKRKRWQGIAESAAKQAKRMYIPQITAVMEFEEALEYAKEMDVKLIPYELAKGIADTRKIINGISLGESVAVFIGPEGGFAEAEVEKAKECGFYPITLGKRILRTETAGLTILAILGYVLEEPLL